jgi:protoheme IX farnesyltransferase
MFGVPGMPNMSGSLEGGREDLGVCDTGAGDALGSKAAGGPDRIPAPPAMGRFRKLAVATTAATFVLIAVGGLVRATGSGLGCPEWPKCHGRWIPPLEHHALIEYSHRLSAAIVVGLIGWLAVWAFVKFRTTPQIARPAWLAGGLVFVQAALGAIVVHGELEAALVTIHFATGMILAGTLVWLTVNAFCAERRTRGKVEATTTAGYAQLTSATAAGVFILLLVGAYVRGLGAGGAFGDWPLMDGKVLPAPGHLATPHFVHRALALIVGGLVVAVAYRAWKREPKEAAVRALSAAAAGLYLAQVGVGAANVFSRLAPAAVVAHVTLAALTWGSVLALAVVSRNLSNPAEETVLAYWRLMKPRIIVLLLITTLPTMVVAAGAWPGTWIVLATLLGGSLAAGGANAINCFIDRDIDAKMGRTRTRPLPNGDVTPAHALEFGIGLGVAAFGWLWATVNLLSAALAIGALLFYVFVYTIGLKRSTPQNIVIGGAAGAVPVLVGWAAVTGTLTVAPLVLFAIVFVWTPPHFWALALKFRKDYERAGVPMLPVVAGVRETHRQILIYSVVLLGVTLAFFPIGRMGAIYLVAAAGLGGWFVRLAVDLWRTGDNGAAMRLFKYSIVYLAALFVAMAIDAVVL